MSDEEHNMDRLYTHDEGLAKMMESIIHSAAYPQGEPYDVSVTLTDEQWSAVNCALQMVLTAQFTDGNKMLPDFMIEQIHNSFHTIRDANMLVSGAQIVETLIEEIQKHD